jgi:hypothetical protein
VVFKEQQVFLGQLASQDHLALLARQGLLDSLVLRDLAVLKDQRANQDRLDFKELRVKLAVHSF